MPPIRSTNAWMRWVFSASALFTIVALGLIILILVKEGAGFFGKHDSSLKVYRLSGMEFTGIMNSNHKEYVEVDHSLTSIRSDWIDYLRNRGIHGTALEAKLSDPKIDSLFKGYRQQLAELRAHIDERITSAIEYRALFEKPQTGSSSATNASLSKVTGELDRYANLLDRLNQSTRELFTHTGDYQFGEAGLEKRLIRAREANYKLANTTKSHLDELARWNADEPMDRSKAVLSFFTGSEWVTASDQQNWFGIIPLVSGSLLVCGIALLIATPFGVGAAIYANQIASAREQALIRPFIEFTSAIPTVVVGFFGVMLFGELVREFSRIDMLQWLPFFPIQERLNAFTAGSLLGLLAVPTIFTLTEEAFNNVPERIKEASSAIGATKLQTIWRTIIPSAFPGIVAAVILGFGRVLGETMVVLLCAGNRVKIPEFEGGIQALFEPVHTMTGMIAQEMGEVVYGSLHYEALFTLGIVLFLVALIINYSARMLARRSGSYRGY